MSAHTHSAAPTRRRALTRERLLDAARDVLAQSGIQGATVEEICERAGFTRGAFYSNFDSKDDLILDLFRREKDLMLGRLQTALVAELRSGPDDIDSLMRGLDLFLEAQPTDRTWFLVHQEFVTHGLRHPEIADVYRELWSQTSEEFAAIVKWATNALGRRLTMPLEHVTLIVMGVYDEAMRGAFLSSTATEFDASVLRAMLPPMLLALSEPV